METYFETKNKKDCNGCGLCSIICPKKAITMKKDQEGFYYPSIDKSKCVNCGLCKKRCSNFNENVNQTECYAAINKKDKELKISSSGGMFLALVNYVLSNKGVVFGAKYDENFNVIHDFGETYEQCKMFSGSKYVRSNLNDSFEKVKKFLEDDRIVLFSGTPCQCHALKVFLLKKYDNLITCEIICHSNPSPEVFSLYKKSIEEKYNSKIKSFDFRSKENGWHNETPIIKLENGKIIEEKCYFNAFGRGLISRPSCHDCKFSSVQKQADFTIGDLWGNDKLDISLNDNDTGISLLCVNTDNGKKIFKEIKDNLITEEIDIQKAFSYNHYCNALPNKNREKFFKKLASGKITEKNIRYYLKKYSERSLIQKIISRIVK